MNDSSSSNWPKLAVIRLEDWMASGSGSMLAATLGRLEEAWVATG
jgi:hypothetical protein